MPHALITGGAGFIGSHLADYLLEREYLVSVIDNLRLGPTSRNRWSYAVSKAIDEFLGFAYYEKENLPVIMCRLFNTVGPRQQGAYGMVLPRFVQWALADEPIQVYGDGEQTRSFCHVADVIPALYQLSHAEDAVGQLFNVGNNDEISIRGLAERVKERANSNSEIVLIPYDEAYQTENYEDFRRRVPGLDKIKDVVGWQPTHSLDDTIDDIIQYYQET